MPPHVYLVPHCTYFIPAAAPRAGTCFSRSSDATIANLTLIVHCSSQLVIAKVFCIISL